MFIVPDNIPAGLLVSAATMQKWTDSIVQLQAAGVLFTSANAATNSNTSGTASSIISWDTAPITLAATRKIQLIQYGLITGSAAGNQAVLSLTLGGLNMTSEIYIAAAGSAGQVDINRSSIIVNLAAGSYAIAAKLTRLGTAGTVTMQGTCIMQIVDLGPV